jgi:tetratricopeptide (TPR) repeat protein
VLRNYIYRSEVSVWRNVVQEAPLNPRGWKELATALLAAEGPSDAAIDCAARAIALDPKYALAYNTFGMLLAQSGRDVPRAIACFREAFRIDPRFAPAHNNLAVALKASAPGEAAEHFRAALAIDPSYADAHNNFGSLLANQGKLTEAIEHFEQAIRLRPGFGAARENLSRAIEMKKSRVATP